jgi:hypothetical protein
MLAITLGCGGAVLTALAWRLAAQPSAQPAKRGAALVATLATTAVLAVWLVTGPLAPGWAQRAGTPSTLLRTAARAPQPLRTQPPVPALERPFDARLEGSLQEGFSAGGSAVVDLRLRLAGGPDGVLRIRIAGQPDSGGGVVMSRSAVTLGPPSAAGQLQGRIDALQDTSLEALVGAHDGRAMRLRVELTLEGASVSGTISGRPVRA